MGNRFCRWRNPPDMLPAMAARPSIAIVGAGRLGSALAIALRKPGYRIAEIVARDRSDSIRKARSLGRIAGSLVRTPPNARLDADVIWFCVPDREIKKAAKQFATSSSWKNKIAFHSSGALPSDELAVLRKRGAAVASVHPLMTFVSETSPSLAGVPFAIEGDAAAAKTARKIAKDLGAVPFAIRKQNKSAYHAWGAFSSPLLVAALATAEQVARIAGLSTADARKKMLPIVGQTIENYSRLGATGALSGPLVRGDIEIIRRHLDALKKLPEAREVYLALARSAVRYLPVRKKRKYRRS